MFEEFQRSLLSIGGPEDSLRSGAAFLSDGESGAIALAILDVEGDGRHIGWLSGKMGCVPLSPLFPFFPLRVEVA
jgi:hypothetical protein